MKDVNPFLVAIIVVVVVTILVPIIGTLAER